MKLNEIDKAKLKGFLKELSEISIKYDLYLGSDYETDTYVYRYKNQKKNALDGIDILAYGIDFDECSNKYILVGKGIL